MILPFEEQFFRSRGMHATFIGHPLLDIQYTETNIVPRETAGSKIIGLLPGSRRSEITRHLPILLESASIMNKQNRGLKFLISVAPSADITFMIYSDRLNSLSQHQGRLLWRLHFTAYQW
ncbi:MAG: hypothetical protein JRF40_02725 [Deltaproteobacteria bacterium]|nr:hypothetical protein [Deltaproteobacteria bacterium]